jgi:2-(3-amino-3-carboxypropyl)histidine synthase
MDPGRVIERLKEIKAKRILLQLPDGLKPHVFDYFNELSKNFNVIVSSSGFYGACDTGTMDEWKNVDAVVQLGHTEIPNVNYKVPVIFEEYINEDHRSFNDLDLTELERNSYKNISLAYSIQYRQSAEELSKFLKEKGYNVSMGKHDSRLKYDGQLLGCNFSPLHDQESRNDCHIIVSTGVFHALGAQLSVEKEVFILDMSEPFRLRSMKSEAERHIRRRYANMARALEAKKFVVAVDTKVGQYRMKLAEKMIKEIQDMGKSAVLAYSNESSPVEFENMMADCIIFTGCPRVATDDFDRYKSPILTAQEFNMIFKKKGNGKYIMDEIVNVDTMP